MRYGRSFDSGYTFSRLGATGHTAHHTADARCTVGSRLFVDNGFTIELERYVVESNRPYLVLSCVKTGERTLHDATDEYLGMSDDMSCGRREYELKLLRSLRKRRRDDSGVVSRVIRVLEERYGV